MHHGKKSPVGLRVIAFLKLITAALLAMTGFGIFHLLSHDINDVVDQVISLLHLDYNNYTINFILEQVEAINPNHLKGIGIGTFFYAALYLVEGIGLFMQQRWAEYLTIIITASLLPIEAYEIAIGVNWIKLVVFGINLIIVVYLAQLLKRDKKLAHRP